jgi:hypothetical protein
MHDIDRAFSLALLNAGNSNAARMAMIAITTSSSIKVKALPLIFGFQLEEFPSHPPKPKPALLSLLFLIIFMPFSISPSFPVLIQY